MPARSRSPRRARLLRSAFVALPLVLLAAGCSTPGSVDDYNAETRDNFILTCEEANSGLGAAEATERCECWATEIMGDEDENIEPGIEFDEFEAIEDEIREALDTGELNAEQLENLVPEFYDVVTDEDCVPVGPAPN